MRKIIDGVHRFQRDIYPGLRPQFLELRASQDPDVLFITCSDSRILPSLLTQTAPGELFIIRNAGNIVPPYGHPGGITATIEYAVMALNVRHIVVCGHSNCGALQGVADPGAVASMPAVAEWLGYGQSASLMVQETFPLAEGEEKLRLLIEQNIIAQLDNLRTHPCVSVRLRQQKLEVHGWYYDISSGGVRVYNRSDDAFHPLESPGVS